MHVMQLALSYVKKETFTGRTFEGERLALVPKKNHLAAGFILRRNE